jgi:hypothetical protein
MAARNSKDDLKAVAKTLYITGTLQKVIAERLSISPVTVNRWVKDGGWEAIRSARNITRPEVVNKILVSISKVIDQMLENQAAGDENALDGLGDKLSKLSSTIERLDKKANVVDAIEVFEDFHMWLSLRQGLDKDITSELLKAINKYQDQYVQEKARR